ncbi:uncharacterized protein J3D65DRAFT_611619 [Phyllosticta citribraziliensis]|uniref:Secreted protein n=1 Tax=Phyllosticta citribraziliensis TaxID=989973 RepID=A0ABR1MB19_9PEZI
MCFFLSLVLLSGVSSGADPQALKLILKRRRVEPSLPTLFPPGPPALRWSGLLLVIAQPNGLTAHPSQLPFAPSPLSPPTKSAEPLPSPCSPNTISAACNLVHVQDASLSPFLR